MCCGLFEGVFPSYVELSFICSPELPAWLGQVSWLIGFHYYAAKSLICVAPSFRFFLHYYYETKLPFRVAFTTADGHGQRTWRGCRKRNMSLEIGCFWAKEFLVASFSLVCDLCSNERNGPVQMSLNMTEKQQNQKIYLSSSDEQVNLFVLVLQVI